MSHKNSETSSKDDLSFGKFYSIDLTAIGHDRIDLIIRIDPPDHLHQYPRENGFPFNYRLNFTKTIINTPWVYVKILASTKKLPYNSIYQLPRDCIKRCIIQEVPSKDLPLWIGSKFLSNEFQNLLKGS